MYARHAIRPAKAVVHVQARNYASPAAASSSKAGTYLLGGLVLGGGSYFLYRQRNTPAWNETRQQAQKAAEDAKSKAQGALAEAKDKARSVAGESKDKFDDAKVKAKGALDEVKDKVAGAVGAAKGAVDSKGGEGSFDGTSSAGNKAFTGGDQGFISLVLEKAEIVNHNTKHLRFKLPNEDDVSGLAVASALLTKYKGPDMEKPAIRPYTPTSDEDAKGYLDLVVKKYPGGPMSSHLHDMEPGQRLDFKGPIAKYPWSENKHEHITLIAGGTGITPMWQLARQIFKNPNDKTKVTLVFGNISEEDILLKKELEELENTYPRRFRAFYTLDNPTGTWSGVKGHINQELLKTVIPEPKEGEKIKIFVCGPPGLYKAVSGTKKSPSDQGELGGILKELGYSKEQVYKF